MSKEKVVVIGNGMVGHRFCEKFVEKKLFEKFELSTFCEEPVPAYDRVHLSQYFEGKSLEDLSLTNLDWYQQNNIQFFLGERADQIIRSEKMILSQSGIKIPYDKIIIATGSSPFVPPITGVDKEGVFVYRTTSDLMDIENYAKKSKTAAVMGGGLLGLEAAKALVDLGLKTHVIEFAPRLMPRQIDKEGSAVLEKEIEKLGVTLHLDKATTEICGDGPMDKILFKDGSELEVDMLVISAGIRPRDEIGKISELGLGNRGGIVVNDYMQTSDPNIYAIGEVALHKDMIYGLVAPGYDMAETAACHLEGKLVPFSTGDLSAKLKLMGVDVASFGDAFAQDENTKTIVYKNDVDGIYKRITISQHDNFLLGGMLVGDASDYGILNQYVKNKTALPKNPEDLILGARGTEDAGSLSVVYLPDDSQICSCNNVNKGAIVEAIREGVTEIGPLKNSTNAGTGCGGCIPMVQDILHGVLESEGKSVSNNVCEHFEYSRQELYDIVRVKEIKTFDELITQYGKGYGCEICKPAVASILASTWNDMILDHDSLQDTNDRFLANIQKGGTYSVVPRVPGGEILPEQLIVLGQVAKKYNLYSKITGGQRIDLFGAQVGQLPDIWEELIQAGFESGHAYGKALRTVKSCVGETWCRYGVQDSVGFAIEIENRYKGIRSPHKMKSACSGCVRECAEAQGKDFGLVATEKGWNLYVCGNGGAKPQHGVLLASDLDEPTVIQLLDRFIMFYIKTADKLTRTSVWFNKLEGGIDYLKDVIIKDKLGICSELEEQMQHLVDTYQCEWKSVVENPEKRKLFSHFLNTEDSDENLKWEMDRGQKKPGNWKPEPLSEPQEVPVP